MIYTSYFANLKNIPETVTPIAICRFPPKSWYGSRAYSLMPTLKALKDYQDTGDEEVFRKRYFEGIDGLDAKRLAKVLEQMNPNSDTHDVVLVCYEGPEKFCHRHLVAEWFNANGIECREWEE